MNLRQNPIGSFWTWYTRTDGQTQPLPCAFISSTACKQL